MSGSETVRAYRQKLAGSASLPAGWRKSVTVLAVAAIAGGFGSIMVQAGDDAGVYDIARSYTTARGTPRYQMPQIFVPAPRPVVRTALSYAPVYQNLAPLPATGKRSVDKARRETKMAVRSSDNPYASLGKILKINPDPSMPAYGAGGSLASRTSYCVRRCDGYFFPLGNADIGSMADHEAACNRICPGAETAVYVAPSGGQGIDDAVSRRGQRYKNTVTAFNYRTQLDAACTCNATGQPRNYSVMNDFTLRPGDLVMSKEGLKVFRGTETYPYRKAHFSAASTAKLTARERRFVQMSDASSLRGMAGARVSPPLEARIAAQIENAKGRSLAAVGLRGIETDIALGDGRAMRYVGPHSPSVMR